MKPAELIGFLIGAVVVLAIAACVPLALIWAFNTLGANIAYSLWNVLAIIVIIVCTRLVIKFDDAETLND